MNLFQIIIITLCSVYMVYNFKHDIHMLQQNSYRISRYWRWLKRSDIKSNWRLADLAVILLLCSTNLLDTRLSALFAAIYAVVKCVLIARRKFKKPLVFTRRVWRIYSVTAVLALLAVVLTAVCTHAMPMVWGRYNGAMLTLILVFAIAILSWLPVMAAVVILTPVERMINARYLREAKQILNSVPDLKIVGITGSYGKTSTKHYLHRILSEQYETLMTPGSFNTPMGVIRTVREYMKPYTEVFICEMGAKQKGDIKEICDIVHPQMGVVTAVGPMHLETFKSLENVCATKFELVDALPADGLAVVSNDFSPSASRPVSNVECIRYGVEHPEGADYHAEDIVYSPQGTDFTIVGRDGSRMQLHTRLVGACNIANLIAAVIIAMRLEVPEEKIRYAVGCIEQVEHRLSIRQHPGGVTVIDDAFNSNPTGANMALDVLAGFNTGGRRILVTPGMIELGAEQYRLNREFGLHAASCADIIIVVGAYNREAITDGLKEAGYPEEQLHTVDSFNEAQHLLQPMLASGDTVLYENDLPDAFK